MQDGRIEYEIKLSGELSTNLLSEGETPNSPDHGVIVAPGVNAQLHQVTPPACQRTRGNVWPCFFLVKSLAKQVDWTQAMAKA